MLYKTSDTARHRAVLLEVDNDMPVGKLEQSCGCRGLVDSSTT